MKPMMSNRIGGIAWSGTRMFHAVTAAPMATTAASVPQKIAAGSRERIEHRKAEHRETADDDRRQHHPLRKTDGRRLTLRIDPEVNRRDEEQQRDCNLDPQTALHESLFPARREEPKEHIDADVLLAADDARRAQENQHHHQDPRHLLGPVERLVQEVAHDHRQEHDDDVDREDHPGKIFDAEEQSVVKPRRTGGAGRRNRLEYFAQVRNLRGLRMHRSPPVRSRFLSD